MAHSKEYSFLVFAHNYTLNLLSFCDVSLCVLIKYVIAEQLFTSFLVILQEDFYSLVKMPLFLMYLNCLCVNINPVVSPTLLVADLVLMLLQCSSQY